LGLVYVLVEPKFNIVSSSADASSESHNHHWYVWGFALSAQ